MVSLPISGFCRFWRKDRNAHEEGRTFALFALQPDVTVVHSDVFLHDRQSKACARSALDQVFLVIAEEALPDTVLLVFSDANARVGNGYHYGAGFWLGANGDCAAVARVIEGVVYQIVQNLRELVVIRANLRQLFRQIHDYIHGLPLVGDSALEMADDGIDDVAHVGR